MTSMSDPARILRRAARAAATGTLLLAGAAGLADCATTAEPEGPPRKETIFAVTESSRLIQFNAGQPGRLLGNRPLTGLEAGKRVLAIDHRVARGHLYALGSTPVASMKSTPRPAHSVLPDAL